MFVLLERLFEIGILNGSGILNMPGTQGDITFRNDSNHIVIIVNRQVPPGGLSTTTLQNATQTSISRTSNVDLIIEVVQIDKGVEMPEEIPIPGTLIITEPSNVTMRNFISTENLTQFGSRFPVGSIPTFFIDSNGVINTISLI